MKADRAKVEKLLKTAKGQLDGILRMVEEDRYCIDISNQILAAQAESGFACLPRPGTWTRKYRPNACRGHCAVEGFSR